MTHPNNRLEEMLQVWEDQCCIYSVIAEYGERLGGYSEDFLARLPLVGPLKHWYELRSHLRMVGNNKGKLDHNRFTKVTNPLWESYGSLFQYPCYLRDWSISSRRIFHVSEELQALLMGMSFRGVHLSDIELPFDCFAITLETSIASPLDMYDAIVVSRLYLPGKSQVGEANGLSIGLLSQSLGEYKALDEYDRKKLRKGGRKGAHSTIELLANHTRRIPDPGPFLSTSIGPGVLQRTLADAPLLIQSGDFRQAFGEVTEDTRSSGPAVDKAYRLVAAFCLYLLSLPANSVHRSRWSSPPTRGKPDPKAITNDALVCTVTSSFTLSAKERSVFMGPPRGPGHELSAHYRSGHFRRRPGKGSDPNAPKVILVKPALVRGDRLQPGQLPGGSQTNAKP